MFIDLRAIDSHSGLVTSLFALIQQFCLLNSNLGLKHFPIKPKHEDHPAEREADPQRAPGCWHGRASPALRGKVPGGPEASWSWRKGPDGSVSF